MTDYPPAKAAYIKEFGDWLKAHDRTDQPPVDVAAFAGEQVSTVDWTTVQLPGKVAGPNLPTNGAIWLRREIEVPTAVQGLVIKASLGQMTAFEDSYWNGKKDFWHALPGLTRRRV